MHIIVLGGRDPDDPENWSGVPKNIVTTLRRQGHKVTTVGPLPPIETAWPRLKHWYYRRIRRKDYVTIRDPGAVRARAPAADALLRSHAPADAVIVLHAADAAYLRCEAPLIFVHDATWHQLLDFYPRYQRRLLAPETIKGGYEIDACALDNCDRVVYSSHWPIKSVVNDYGLGTGKAVVQPFGANLAWVPSRVELEQRISRRGDRVCRLLFVGKDWFRKGGDIAVVIAQQLHARGLPVELQVVGCHSMGDVPEYVQEIGFMSKKNPAHAAHLEQLFMDADFLLLPTRADCTPIVLNEAAAFGLPVVTSAVGGIPEIVHDSWGVALPPGAAPAEHADWIHAIYNDREAYERRARAARDQFDRQNNWDTFCCALTAIIDELRVPDSVRRAKVPQGKRETV